MTQQRMSYAKSRRNKPLGYKQYKSTESHRYHPAYTQNKRKFDFFALPKDVAKALRRNKSAPVVQPASNGRTINPYHVHQSSQPKNANVRFVQVPVTEKGFVRNKTQHQTTLEFR